MGWLSTKAEEIREVEYFKKLILHLLREATESFPYTYPNQQTNYLKYYN
jgi:hypothetical protein